MRSEGIRNNEWLGKKQERFRLNVQWNVFPVERLACFNAQTHQQYIYDGQRGSILRTPVFQAAQPSSLPWFSRLACCLLGRLLISHMHQGAKSSQPRIGFPFPGLTSKETKTIGYKGAWMNTMKLMAWRKTRQTSLLLVHEAPYAIKRSFATT
jgi:hypothetical protein